MGSLYSSDVYKCESGRCHTLPTFLTFFIFSPFQVFVFILINRIIVENTNCAFVGRWLHLLFNLLVQVLVGLPLEMVHGSLRIGVVYMAGVLAGSLGTSVFDTEVYLVGASGGVYALLAAHLANVLLVSSCSSVLSFLEQPK